MGLLRKNTHTARINDIKIDVYKLHNSTEDHPIEIYKISVFTEELEYPCWSTIKAKDDKKKNRISPQEVINTLAEHGYIKSMLKFPKLRHHFKQIKRADIDYPIHVYKNHVVDGMHRLAKISLSLKLGETTNDSVLVKKLEKIPEVAIIK